MDSLNYNAEAQEVDSLGQNENSQTEIIVNSASCEICAPSMMSPPLSPEHQEEMQDATPGYNKRGSARSRKVMSSSEEDMSMPMSRSRSNSSKRGKSASKRGRGAKSTRSRSASKKSGGRSASRSKSRPRKSSTSRRGRRA